MIPRSFLKCNQHFQQLQVRAYSKAPTASTPPTSPFSPRHLLSCADLSSRELASIVKRAYRLKQQLKKGRRVEHGLSGKTVAMIFNKRSTRTRVSTESATAALGGHSMFLGKDDIQLGVNESARDTSTVISSMVAAMVARVSAHEDVAELAKHSTVPVINALSDEFHPLQAITDCLSLYETFSSKPRELDLGLKGLQIAWVGDANNVLFDLAIAAGKLGINLHVATPSEHSIPNSMLAQIQSPDPEARISGSLLETNVPEEAVKDADVIFTDTWVSMGQEAEKNKRLQAFDGYQVTEDLARRGGANEGWKFMHCLPRHPEEVSDEVFYHPQRSLVFTEAENRLYTMISVLWVLVARQGRIEASNDSEQAPSNTDE